MGCGALSGAKADGARERGHLVLPVVLPDQCPQRCLARTPLGELLGVCAAGDFSWSVFLRVRYIMWEELR